MKKILVFLPVVLSLDRITGNSKDYRSNEKAAANEAQEFNKFIELAENRFGALAYVQHSNDRELDFEPFLKYLKSLKENASNEFKSIYVKKVWQLHSKHLRMNHMKHLTKSEEEWELEKSALHAFLPAVKEYYELLEKRVNQKYHESLAIALQDNPFPIIEQVNNDLQKAIRENKPYGNEELENSLQKTREIEKVFYPKVPVRSNFNRDYGVPGYRIMV